MAKVGNKEKDFALERLRDTTEETLKRVIVGYSRYHAAPDGNTLASKLIKETKEYKARKVAAEKIVAKIRAAVKGSEDLVVLSVDSNYTALAAGLKEQYSEEIEAAVKVQEEKYNAIQKTYQDARESIMFVDSPPEMLAVLKDFRETLEKIK